MTLNRRVGEMPINKFKGVRNMTQLLIDEPSMLFELHLAKGIGLK